MFADTLKTSLPVADCSKFLLRRRGETCQWYSQCRGWWLTSAGVVDQEVQRKSMDTLVYQLVYTPTPVPSWPRGGGVQGRGAQNFRLLGKCWKILVYKMQNLGYFLGGEIQKQIWDFAQPQPPLGKFAVPIGKWQLPAPSTFLTPARRRWPARRDCSLRCVIYNLVLPNSWSFSSSCCRCWSSRAGTSDVVASAELLSPDVACSAPLNGACRLRPTTDRPPAPVIVGSRASSEDGGTASVCRVVGVAAAASMLGKLRLLSEFIGSCSNMATRLATDCASVGDSRSLSQPTAEQFYTLTTHTNRPPTQ